MKFSHGTEFHFGRPKYSDVIDRLICTGLFLAILGQYIFPKAPPWVSALGWLLLLAALVVMLVGTVAERKEWEAKRHAGTK